MLLTVVYAPQYSCTSGSFFFRSRNATGSRYTTTVSSMEAGQCFQLFA